MGTRRTKQRSFSSKLTGTCIDRLLASLGLWRLLTLIVSWIHTICNFCAVLWRLKDIPKEDLERSGEIRFQHSCAYSSEKNPNVLCHFMTFINICISAWCTAIFESIIVSRLFKKFHKQTRKFLLPRSQIPILRQVNPVPIYSYFLYKTRFNIILNPSVSVVLPSDLIPFLKFSSALS
jgi:hypothetical protein